MAKCGSVQLNRTMKPTSKIPQIKRSTSSCHWLWIAKIPLIIGRTRAVFMYQTGARDSNSITRAGKILSMLWKEILLTTSGMCLCMRPKSGSWDSAGLCHGLAFGTITMVASPLEHASLGLAVSRPIFHTEQKYVTLRMTMYPMTMQLIDWETVLIYNFICMLYI